MKEPTSEYDPDVYLTPTDKTFSLQTPMIDRVHRLLKTTDEKKSCDIAKPSDKNLARKNKRYFNRKCINDMQISGKEEK